MPKHLIEMTKSDHGVDVGRIYPELFKEGKKYVVGESLAKGFESRKTANILKQVPDDYEHPDDDRASKKKAETNAPTEIPKDVASLNKAQLLELGASLEIEGIKASLTKDELVELIEAERDKE